VSGDLIPDTNFAQGASGGSQVYNIGPGALDVLPAGLVPGQSSSASTILPHLTVRGPDDTTQVGVAYGHTTGVTVGPNPATYGPVSFGITFASAPTVFLSPAPIRADFASTDITTTTTAFTLHNQGNGTDPRDFYWLAIGPV
jgi:hypothetical protein